MDDVRGESMMDFTNLKKLNIDGIDAVQLFINGVQVFKAGYKNWVKYSTEADGVTIYNGGLGYKNGYRLSSGGGESTLSGGTVTGFIPVKAGDTIRIGGCKWYDAVASVNYFIVYDSAFQKVYTGNAKGAYQTTTFIDSMTYDDTTGISTVVLKPGVAGYEHFRICISGANGENVIVTINEEIV